MSDLLIIPHVLDLLTSRPGMKDVDPTHSTILCRQFSLLYNILLGHDSPSHSWTTLPDHLGKMISCELISFIEFIPFLNNSLKFAAPTFSSFLLPTLVSIHLSVQGIPRLILVPGFHRCTHVLLNGCMDEHH